MDIRQTLGDDVKIVLHDKKQRVTLINPDKADDWKKPSQKHRKISPSLTGKIIFHKFSGCFV